MKRGGPLKRTSRLSPGTKQLRRAALNRSAENTRAAARKPLVAKPAKRDPAEAPARKALRGRSGGLCELHGNHPATDAHHRQNRSQGGEWAIENLLHLCHEVHMQITVNPAVAYERGWSVRSTHNPAEVAVWLAGRGWHYLLPDGGVRPADERKTA